MSLTDIIRDLLDQQYPNVEDIKTIVITNIQLRLLPLPAKPYFLRYSNLETLVLSKCDLRTLQNFPRVYSLRSLDLSGNSLQGSLNYLMPLSSLSYLNIADNLIGDSRKLQPLQMIDNLEVYVAGNPFVEGQVWKNKVKNYGLKVLKQPKTLEPVVKQQDKKEEKKNQGQSIIGVMQPSINPIPIRRSSFLFQIRARRQRLQEQMMERRNIRRRIIEPDSDSGEMLEIIRRSDFVPQMIDNQELEESQGLNEEDSDNDNDENSKKDEDEDEMDLQDEFQPLFNVFDNEQLQIEDEEEDDSDGDIS